MKPDDLDGSKPQGASSRLRRILVEPFFHFVLFGALIFAASEYYESLSTRYHINVGPAQIQRLQNAYAQQYGLPPTPGEMKALVERYILEEILHREALALGLDKDDEIVRRRLAQKYEFLQQDLSVPGTPAEKDLEAYFEAHSARYALPAKRSFTQVYFSPDADGNDGARRRAEEALRDLRSSNPARAASIGDAFPGASDVSRLSLDDVNRLFGVSSFGRGVFESPVGEWSGPLKSGFGWHLLKVTEDVPGRPRQLSEVRSEVAGDLQEERRIAQNKASFESVKSKYRITSEGMPLETGSLAQEAGPAK